MGANLASVYVSVNGTPRVVTCRLGGAREVERLAAWRRQTRNRDADALDALEFAKLTGKRWEFYISRRRAVSSLQAARSRVRREPKAELAFLAVLTASWAPDRILGISLFRRSWCNHLIVDFIASHPSNWDDSTSDVRGILRAIFAGITQVAAALRTQRIWGEATDSSSAKYQHIFELASADDLFVVEKDKWRSFLKKGQRARR